MYRVSKAGWVFMAMAAAGMAAGHIALAATGARDAQEVVEAAAGPTQALAGYANLTMRFIQEDGPDSGHVRVVLTPETRPLTVIEARSAAQQAFLEALKEPGLGDNLSRIIVEVRLMPRSHPDPEGAHTTIVFLHSGGQNWSVTAAE